MTPKHIYPVPDRDNSGVKRKATAPYNFVELPDKVVEIAKEFLLSENRYYPEFEHRYTGKIKCTLTTKSPLYIRCGWTPEDFAKFSDKSDEDLSPEERVEKRRKLSDFFRDPVDQRPTLPGSSLRGMLRTLVEIVSFGKIERVSDQQRFFFRAVAERGNDPLKREYEDRMGKFGKNVRAGYLLEQEGSWFVRPTSFVWVRESDLRAKVRALIHLKETNYRPQYISVSFERVRTRNYRRFAENISCKPNAYFHRGVLVTSGNMRQQGDTSEPLRKNHCIVLEVDESITPLKISDDAIQHYCNALTDFQKQEPFDKKMGLLKNGRPIFYCEPQSGQSEINLFGQSPNFRIPYSPNRDGRAASAVDFIPKKLRQSDTIDLADAIFGFAKTRDNERDKKTDANWLRALAGRVFIEDAICEKTANEDIWLTSNPDEIVTPRILSTPKPTTFQHYLVQRSFEKSQLEHYASKPPAETEPGETVIRGHKLYWHKPDVGRDQIEESDREKIERSRSQYTDIKPIRTGVSFDFTIHFENLKDIELGALLWVLNKAQEDLFCLSLGMGKPLGMGAVKITHELLLSDRQKRYGKLFAANQWATGENSDTTTQHKSCVEAFEKYILRQISDSDHPKERKATALEELPRIEMLLAMLRCDRPPAAEETQYMTIEPDNQYKDRPVLPTPLQVMEWEDHRRLYDPPESPQTSKGSRGSGRFSNSSGNSVNTPSSQSKGSGKSQPITKKSQQSNQQAQKKPKDDSSGGVNPALTRPRKPPKPKS